MHKKRRLLELSNVAAGFITEVLVRSYILTSRERVILYELIGFDLPEGLLEQETKDKKKDFYLDDGSEDSSEILSLYREVCIVVLQKNGSTQGKGLLARELFREPKRATGVARDKAVSLFMSTRKVHVEEQS